MTTTTDYPLSLNPVYMIAPMPTIERVTKEVSVWNDLTDEPATIIVTWLCENDEVTVIDADLSGLNNPTDDINEAITKHYKNELPHIQINYAA